MSLGLLWGSYSYLLLPVMGFLIFFFLSFFSIVQGKKNTTTLFFALMCFLGALIDLDIALVSFIKDENLALRLDRFSYLFFVFAIPVYIRFVHSFLGITERRWIERGAYLFSITLLPFTQTEYFITGLRSFSFGKIAGAGPVYHLFSAVGGVAVLYCIVTLVLGMRGAKGNRARNRIQYVLIGFGLSGLLILLNILPISGYDVYPMGNFNFVPAIILAFAVLKYDLLDIGVLLRKGSAYFFLTGILTFVYALAIYLSNIISIGYGNSHPFVISFISAVVIVVLFNPLRIKVQALVDQVFFRGKYDYQETLRQMSGAMASFLRIEEIIDFLLNSIPSALKTSGMWVGIYRQGNGSLDMYARRKRRGAKKGKEVIRPARPIEIFFETYRDTLVHSALGRIAIPVDEEKSLSDLFDATSAAVLIPMISQDRLTGIMALGEKRSGELFVYEDIELLETIASQGAIAIENAKNYEQLEEMNLRLEEKVRQRTQALTAALDEKERTQQQLIRSESLASIGQLVAGAAHELNNPLASSSSLIQTSLETISEWNDAEDQEREELIGDLKFSLKELDRAAGIVRSLLGLSRQTQDYVEQVNVNALINDALRVIHNRYKKSDIAIDKNLEENLPDIEGNFANLGQVILNIMNNAIQAQTDGSGTVTLATRYMEDEDMVRIECRDTGKGMAAEEVRDAFKPFFTTKKPGEGTGLGLYIAHEIVRRHDGRITIESEIKRGTTVSVSLPCRRRKEQ